MSTKSRVIITGIGICLLTASVAPNLYAASDRLIASFPAPTTLPSGLAFDNGVLYVAEVPTQTVFRLDATSGSVLGSYVLSPPPPGLMRGLAYSSGYLWVGAGISSGYLYKVVATDGSVVASYALPGISAPDGLAADANYVYIANNDKTDRKDYKFYPASGTYVASWESTAKYPSGMTRITHVPSSTQVLLNLGNVDGWVRIYGVDGTPRPGEGFLIDVPCGIPNYVGDLATLDATHFFFAADEFDYIYELELDWGGQEYPAVAPASWGKIKALYR